MSLGDDSEYLNAFKEFTVNNRHSTLASLSTTLLKAIKPTFEEGIYVVRVCKHRKGMLSRVSLECRLSEDAGALQIKEN